MAGLPKAAFLLMLTLGIATTFAIASVADEVQTDSVVLPPTLPPADVQTDSVVLQSVFDLIGANLYADPIDQANLEASFEDAVTMGVLTPEEALAMLELVQWETLDGVEALANAAAAIQTVLADLASNPLSGDDPLDVLTQLLNVLDTPAGTLNAIGKAGASQEILDQVSSLVADGVPPGVLVRITKQGLRDGLTPEQITAQLDALAVAIAEDEDLAWGQIANDITSTGENKHQDQEQNANISGNEEPEEEANTHGNGNGSGKEKDASPDDKQDDESPGNGQGKGKNK